MPLKAIQKFQELPVADNQRKPTDILCAIVGIVLTLAMFIAACVSMNSTSLYQINYPTDSDGRTCGYQLEGFPYLYFTNPSSNNIHDRICVSTCPTVGDVVMCSPTSRIKCSSPQIQIYQTQATINRLGGYCLPKSQTRLQSVKRTFNLHHKWNFLKSYDIIQMSLLIALLLGTGFLLLVQFLPRAAVWASVGLAGISCIVLAVMLLTDTSPSFHQAGSIITVIAVCILLLGLLNIFYLFWLRKQIRVCSIFIQSATRFLAGSPLVFAYIPLYIVLSMGFLFLMVFQYLAFSSLNHLYMVPGDIYWQTSSVNIWNILNLIELIWGISFLRDSFNYNVSGNATEWYFMHRPTRCMLPFNRMICLNYGSIVAGSFFNGIFFIPQLLFDILNPEQKGPCSLLAAPCHCLCGALLNLFELIREDAYAYINLTGSPYCNAASCSQYLCHRSQKLEGGQSANRIFRLSGHFLLLSIIVIIGYSIDKSTLLNGDVSPKALLCILGVGFFMVTYFILIHSDSADGLLITYLCQDYMANQHNCELSQCPQDLRMAIRELQAETGY